MSPVTEWRNESPKLRPHKKQAYFALQTSLFYDTSKPISRHKQAYFAMPSKRTGYQLILAALRKRGQTTHALEYFAFAHTCFRLASDVYYTTKCLTLPCQVTCLRWVSTAFTSRKWVAQQNNAPQTQEIARPLLQIAGKAVAWCCFGDKNKSWFVLHCLHFAVTLHIVGNSAPILSLSSNKGERGKSGQHREPHFRK